MRRIDRILYNGKIVTLNSAQPHASALAIAAGRIIALGDDAAIRSLADADTVVENVGGRQILPGLTDAHIHFELTAQSLHEVDVFEVPDKQTAVERVGKHVQGIPAGQWVTGHGWFQDLWQDSSFPTVGDIDAVAPHHAIFLTAKSKHAAWVNSLALQLAGIDRTTPDPEGGQIVRDAQGNPTGMLLETAIGLVSRHIPVLTLEQRADQFEVMQARALAFGLTGVHDFDEPSALRAFQVMRERGTLGLRVVKQVNKQWINAALDTGLRTGFGDDWIRIGGLKLFADGALGPRTAAMIEPYDGEPTNFGIVTLEKEEMIELISRASANGLPSTVHAIGDRAVHDVLNAFEVVRREEQERGEHPSIRRHRIEHVQVIHPADIPRLAELNIIASMQPIHATSDMQSADRYWGARARWSYNPRVQLDQGVVVALGSDAPVEPFDPLTGIHAAVTRQRADGAPGESGWYPDARLTVDEAVRGYTIGPAYAAGMEDRSGRLAPGYLADLIVLDRDIYTIHPSAILEARVEATMVGGEWRYGGV